MVGQKPLPALPPLAELSVEARQHRAHLIRHFLLEIRESGIEYRRDAWAEVLGAALDELGQCLSKGKWLDGVRRWREQQRQKRKREREIEREGRRQDAINAKKSAKSPDEGESVKQSDSAESSIESSRESPSIPPTAPKPEGKYLLLCVAPPGSTSAIEESRFDMVSGDVGCTFLSGTYAFQGATILYGDKEVSLVRSVGGTFSFKGVTSPEQYKHFIRVLRLSVYVHLALMLERHLLVDSSIKLIFPQPKLSVTSPSGPPGRSASSESIDGMLKKPTITAPSFLHPGIFSFLSKSSMMRQRAGTAMSRLGRGHGPLSPPATPVTPPASTHTYQELSRGLPTSLRFSLLGKKTAAETKTAAKPPFTRTLELLEANAGLLSTSVGVRFDPPALIVGLAERETGMGLKLNAGERAAMTTILGWEGPSNHARGMIGTAGFMRQQGIEVLQSQHVPDLTAGLGALLVCDGETLLVCGRPLWRRYRYYAQEEEEDVSLGTALMEFAEAADRPCEVAKGKHTYGLHETRLVHGDVRVIITVEKDEHGREGEEGPIEIWESCMTCRSRSARRHMSDGTYLLSYGKFLELLIYSPRFGMPSPAHCPHTERFDIQRHFATRTWVVSFACTRAEDIFELRIPPLQMTRGEGPPRDDASWQMGDGQSVEQKAGEQERRDLRGEIRRWWRGVADYMDRLEAVVAHGDDTDETRKSKSKALPRIPSTDEHDEDGESKNPSIMRPVTPSVSRTPSNTTALPLGDHGVYTTPPSAPAHSNAPAPPAPPPETSTPPDSQKTQQEGQQPLERLENLRQTFHRKEQSLYSQLSRTTKANLNDVRRSFTSAAKGSEKRLDAWRKKHLNGDEGLEWKGSEEPEWWKPGSHACPGSDVIMREDDLGSIIAFTLSSSDYQRELDSMSAPRSVTTSPQNPQTGPPTIETYSEPQSYFSPQNSSSSSQKPSDPDVDDGTWDTPEYFSASVSRMDHSRDVTSSLMSIREVLRREQKSPAPESSRFGSLGRGAAPLSGWGAKPDVQLSKQEADGIVAQERADGPGKAGKKLQELESMSSRLGLRLSQGAAAGATEPQQDKGKTSSVESVGSDATVGKQSGKEAGEGLPPMSAGKAQEHPPPLPPKDDQYMTREQERSRDASSTTTPSSIANTLTSGLGNAIRFMLHPVGGAGGAGGGEGGGDGDSGLGLGGATRPTVPSPKGQYGLLSLDAAGIDEQPHIKYDWTIGKRLKFSCTVYYAKQFDLLRRRCAVDEIYARSLRHSANWEAEGGKSRSNFWKTGDDRFIIKTLVDAWNVADLQVLVDLGPSYFRYLDTTEHPTVITKMIGFYTVEIRNLETGTIQSKTDLLVMENLFYNQKVDKTFDLKGIQGRKVKPANGFKVAQNPKTLYDGEWIEGQQKSLMLVRPHSKHVLHTAVKNDAEFLAKSNIMDYSLLVGINEEEKVIVCGLVDTIGSYTFAKTLEYKAKQGLTSGREITVIPPVEYEERFVSALDGYFLPCPDKWSKPVTKTKLVSDVSDLPSVL